MLFRSSSYRHDETSSWADAYEAFKKWYEESYKKQIELTLNGDELRDPLNPVYKDILTFLTAHSNDNSPLPFSDFIATLFTRVIRDYDARIDRERIVTDKYREDYERARRLLNPDLPEKLADASITPNEAAEILKEHSQIDIRSIVNQLQVIQEEVTRLSEATDRIA